MTSRFWLCTAVCAGMLIQCAYSASVHRNRFARPADAATPWWRKYVDMSLAQGTLYIEELPYNLSTNDAFSTLQALCLSRPDTVTPTNVIVNVGLPTEAALFSQHG